MAESIFTVLATRSTSTTVPFLGKDDDNKTISVQHTIPDELFPTDEEFESPEKLIEWANQTGCTYEMLQKGVGKALIEVRAKFKAPKKGKDGSPDLWDKIYGQSQVDAMEWTPVKRPNQSGNSENIAKAVLKETITNMQLMIDVAGLTEAKIIEVLNDKFESDDTIVKAIISALNFPA